MLHSPGFSSVVNHARAGVQEISVAEARARIDVADGVVLLDVREDHEWQMEHAAEAEHLGRGILERDIEKRFPDTTTELIMYCGGGYRSVLACEAAQRMGYRNVKSLIGGYKGMKAAGWPMTTAS